MPLQMEALPHSPAADRNNLPILQELRQVLPPAGAALEIASGTGQHLRARDASWGIRRLPDVESESLRAGLAAPAACDAGQ